jgi:hypothetical protein
MQLTSSTSLDTTDLGSGARIALCVDQFDLVTNMLGHTTAEAKAAFIGMDPGAVSRARNGGYVSDRFVARTLAALGRHRGWFAKRRTPITFEALFVIVAPTSSAPERVA